LTASAFRGWSTARRRFRKLRRKRTVAARQGECDAGSDAGSSLEEADMCPACMHCAREHSNDGPHLDRRTERTHRTKTSPRKTHDAETSTRKACGEMNMATSTVEHSKVVSRAEWPAARRPPLSRRKGTYSRFRRNQQAAPGITVDEGGTRVCLRWSGGADNALRSFRGTQPVDHQSFHVRSRMEGRMRELFVWRRPS
jgi:hypothetical protein